MNQELDAMDAKTMESALSFPERSQQNRRRVRLALFGIGTFAAGVLFGKSFPMPGPQTPQAPLSGDLSLIMAAPAAGFAGMTPEGAALRDYFPAQFPGRGREGAFSETLPEQF